MAYVLVVLLSLASSEFVSIALWVAMAAIASPVSGLPPVWTLGVLALTGGIFGIIVSLHKKYMTISLPATDPEISDGDK